MARMNYSEDFRRQAVDLYLNTPGATFKAIAADLGIARGTLQNWVYAQHPQGRTAPEATTATLAVPAKGESAASWRPNATSCARRPSISRGRRTGEEP
ncbi:transposase [Nocardiopsis oceani]